MAFVLIVALITAVITLSWLGVQQSKTIAKYEQELIKKARKSKK
jgi:signal transduction histidine kinase